MTTGRIWQGEEVGRGTPACGAGTAPASAQLWAEIGHLRVREEGYWLASREQGVASECVQL